MRRLDLMPSGPYLPTASELHRAQECVAVWAHGLPEVRETNEWAEFGHKNHRYSERLVGNGNVLGHWDTIVQGVDDATKALLENVYTLLHIDLGDAKAFRWPDGFTVALRAEIGIKWRPGLLADEAQQCKRAPGERLRGWFAGTADLVYVRTDGVLVVADWKFGPRAKYVDAKAKNHFQGWFLALAFCALLEITGSSDSVVVARFEARYVDADGIEIDGCDITWGEICEWRETLAGIAKRIVERVDAQPRTSEACRRCKAAPKCPAKLAERDEVRRRVFEQFERVFDTLPETADDARILVLVAEAAEALRDDSRAKVKAWLMGNRAAIPVGLGLELRAVPNGSDKVVLTDDALDLIEEVAGKNAVVFQRKATMESIKGAARAPAGKGKEETKDEAEARVVGKLREAGAIVPRGGGFSVRMFRTRDKDDKGKPVPGYGTFDE